MRLTSANGYHSLKVNIIYIMRTIWAMLHLMNSQFDHLKQRLACPLDWAYRAALAAGATNLTPWLASCASRRVHFVTPARSEKAFLLQPVASRAICRPWSTGCNSLYVPGTTLSPTRRPLATSAPTGSVCAETR